MSMKPFSEACEQNKEPILAVLREELAAARQLLEIGSGTGQHAVHFAAALPQLSWTASDRAEHLAGIRAWRDEAALPNLHGPLELDVDAPQWPIGTVDAVFSANTAHIMHWSSVVNMFAGVAHILAPGGLFCLYGPFNYGGAYTSASNARFDAWLKARDPGSGVRDRDDLAELGARHGLRLVRDHAMPANNRILVWEREPA